MMFEDVRVTKDSVPFLKVKALRKEFDGLQQKLSGTEQTTALMRLLRKILFSLQFGKADIPKEASAIAYMIAVTLKE